MTDASVLVDFSYVVVVYTLLLPENAVKHFVAIYSELQIHFSYFDQTTTEILSIFHTKKLTYLWHTKEATAISDTKNKQHIQKMGKAHSC